MTKSNKILVTNNQTADVIEFSDLAAKMQASELNRLANDTKIKSKLNAIISHLTRPINALPSRGARQV